MSCSLRAAVELINGLAVKRLPLILNRVVVHLKDRTPAIFNADELAQLTTLFSLTLEQVHTILDSMSYIYEQAAYHLLTSEKLKAQMVDVLQLGEQPATAIAYVWNEQREAYMVNLRERSFGLPLVSPHTEHEHISLLGAKTNEFTAASWLASGRLAHRSRCVVALFFPCRHLIPFTIAVT